MKSKAKKPERKNSKLIIILLIIGAIPVLLFVLGLVAAVVLAAINPQLQIQKGKCVQACTEQYSKSTDEYNSCITACTNLK